MCPPGWRGRDKRARFTGDAGDRNRPGVETHRRLMRQQRAVCASLTTTNPDGIVDKRPAQVPQVQSDLIGATSHRHHLDQTGGVFKALDDLKVGLRIESVLCRLTDAGRAGGSGNGGGALEAIIRWVTMDSCKVRLADGAFFELFPDPASG